MRKLLTVLTLGLLCVSGAGASVLDGLAIQDRGRKKPFTVFAHEASMMLAGAGSVTVEGQRRTAEELVLGLWLEPEVWQWAPLVLVDHVPLRRELGLADRERRYAAEELLQSPAFRKLQEQLRAFQRDRATEKLPPLLAEVNNVTQRLELWRGLTGGTGVRLVPHAQSKLGTWEPLGSEEVDALRTAYKGGSVSWERELQGLITRLRASSPEVYPSAGELAFESFYLRLHPWRWAWVLYAAAALVLLVPALSNSPWAYRAAISLAVAGFLFQLWGFVARVLISGRAPVTNMYESIIWVAFGTMLFALFFEWRYRSRYFLIASAPVAVAALIFTDLQPVVFDRSIQPLVAVLNNNFWLTIHVLTITLSYGAFALALGLGHVALGRLITGTPREKLGELFLFNYRALQIGVLLLAAGTLLGAVWANYSWGRFWDWDPKETWALVALLAYLIVLHGRIAGRWSGVGIAVGSILGFQAVIMAWYGVNFWLGTGLHSYGFGSGGFQYAVAFVALEICFILFAIARLRPMGGAAKAA